VKVLLSSVSMGDGCASIVCSRKHLPQVFKLVNYDNNDNIIELAKKITTSCRMTSADSRTLVCEWPSGLF